MTTPAGNPDRGRIVARAMFLMGVAYPLLAHLTVLSARPALIAASIGWLTLLVLLPGLGRGRPFAWLLLALAAAGLSTAVTAGHAVLLLFLPPILLNAFMAWLFGHTLRAGRMPLIERVARVMHGPDDPLDPTIVAYARQVTQAWTGLFVVLAAVNLVLATFARPGGFLLAAGVDPGFSVPLAAWSLFANVLTYPIIAALFVAEYLVRQRRFPDQPYRGPLDFMRRLAALADLFRPTGRGWASDHDLGRGD
jgi:uncharacterized membrane protein